MRSVKAATFQLHLQLERVIFDPAVRRSGQLVDRNESFITKTCRYVFFELVFKCPSFIFFAKPIDQSQLELGLHFVVVGIRWIKASQKNRQIGAAASECIILRVDEEAQASAIEELASSIVSRVQEALHVVYLEGKIRFWPVDVHVSNLFLSLHCAERFEKSRISKWLEEIFFNEVQRFLQNLYLGGKNKILRPQKDLRALTLNQAV